MRNSLRIDGRLAGGAMQPSGKGQLAECGNGNAPFAQLYLDWSIGDGGLTCTGHCCGTGHMETADTPASGR